MNEFQMIIIAEFCSSVWIFAIYVFLRSQNCAIHKFHRPYDVKKNGGSTKIDYNLYIYLRRANCLRGAKLKTFLLWWDHCGFS